MILHPVAIFGTSDKKLVVLLPMMLIFFVLKSVQVVLLCKSSDDILRHASLLYLGGEGRTNESPLKQSRLDQKEACKLEWRYPNTGNMGSSKSPAEAFFKREGPSYMLHP
uniref:Uncharacterized protein n=1 Tax=Solanum lycopersicum TaxID=4081 RepID=A0A3Q7GC78_SOLLC